MISAPADIRKNAIDALRDATHALHQALDNGLPIVSPDAGLKDYIAHLQAIYGWLAPLERCLAATANAPALSSQPDLCSHSHAIEADLQDAGITLPRLDTLQPRNRALPYLWGQAYVAAGSQLGGAVLYKRLTRRLAPHPMRYFAGERICPSVPWPEFVARLNAAVITSADQALCREGAVDAFTYLTERLHAVGRMT